MTDDDLKAELEQAIDRVFRGHPFPTVREMRDAIWPIVARERSALREVQARVDATAAWATLHESRPPYENAGMRGYQEACIDVLARLAPPAPADAPKEDK